MTAIMCGDSPKTLLTSLRPPDALVAGTCGGLASTLVVHPLDLLKLRFAVNEGVHSGRPQYASYWQCARSIVAARGWRGLYQGATPNILGNCAAWGFYFHFYNLAKHRLFTGDETELRFYERLLAGILAGSTTLAITNPIWVVKTRLCLQYEQSDTVYRGVADALRKTFRHEGVRGLYKDTVQYLGFAAGSKMFAATVTYPYQVVRARIQDHNRQYAGIMDVIVKTWSREGVLGFYKGLLPSLIRVTPATCITFAVYENVSHLLDDR